MIMIRYLTRIFTKPSVITFATSKSEKITDDFTQLNSKDKNVVITSGRSWRAQQLRLKSTEDLHKLWFICVKEKNILQADGNLSIKMTHKNNTKPRIKKIKFTMKRILTVVSEREQIRKNYRQQLQQQYIQKKKKQMEVEIEGSKQEQTPQITWQLLRAKYHELRKGVDNIQYLERIWKQRENNSQRRVKARKRSQTRENQTTLEKFTSFWEQETAIGDRPTQQEILRAHVSNWKMLNLKQRKIILGFLNARRSKDAKAAFIRQLKILGKKIAYDQTKDRLINQNNTINNQ